MVQVNLKQLVGKLNNVNRQSMEAAAGFCLSRTNYNVEVEHWLLKLIESNNTDIVVALRHFGVDISRLAADLTAAIDRFKTGNSRSPTLSPDLVALIRNAWLIGSIDFGSRVARSGHVLCALLSDQSLARIADGASKEFEKVSVEALHNQLEQITSDTDEAADPGVVDTGSAAAPGKPGGPTKTPSLDQNCSR